MGIEIERVDPDSMSDASLEELARLYDVLEAEYLPDDPPVPVEKRIVDWGMSFARFPARRWALRADGRLVAVAVTQYDTEENLTNGTARVSVHPEHRGKGYARLLATTALDHLGEMGRTRVDTWIVEGSTAEALAEKLGLEAVLVERRSRLLIDELDLGLMRAWIERASQRASDYELVAMTAPFPEESLQRYCDMMYIMNSAPLEDYEMEEEHITPENWRDIESRVLAGHNNILNLTAVHKPTGEYVGYTQVKTQDLQPDLAWQWDTGVHPDHRNKGLGRWLKAAMVIGLVERYPRVRRIDTENAGSNEPMLNINRAMGFEPLYDVRIWQGELQTVRERLGV